MTWYCTSRTPTGGWVGGTPKVGRGRAAAVRPWAGQGRVAGTQEASRRAALRGGWSRLPVAAAGCAGAAAWGCGAAASCGLCPSCVFPHPARLACAWPPLPRARPQGLSLGRGRHLHDGQVCALQPHRQVHHRLCQGQRHRGGGARDEGGPTGGPCRVARVCRASGEERVRRPRRGLRLRRPAEAWPGLGMNALPCWMPRRLRLRPSSLLLLRHLERRSTKQLENNTKDNASCGKGSRGATSQPVPAALPRRWWCATATTRTRSRRRAPRRSPSMPTEASAAWASPRPPATARVRTPRRGRGRFYPVAAEALLPLLVLVLVLLLHLLPLVATRRAGRVMRRTRRRHAARLASGSSARPLSGRLPLPSPLPHISHMHMHS